MTDAVPTKIRHPRVWWSRAKLKWPFLVWIGAIALLLWIYQDAVHTGVVAGVVEVIHDEPAPFETARLVKLSIVEGQPVKTGDLIAQFDATLIDAEIAQIKSQTETDQFQFTAHIAELDLNNSIQNTQMDRQFERAVDDGEVRLRELKFRQLLDTSRYDVLSNQIGQIVAVMGSAPNEARELILYRAEMDSLASAIKLYPDMIRATEGDIATARRRADASHLWTNSIASVTNAIAAQMRYAASREYIAALNQRKDRYTLRATHDGIVSRVYHRDGKIVKAADPVASIVVSESQRVIGFVPEWFVHDVKLGDEGFVTQPLRKIQPMKARVITIGPEIISLPAAASTVPGQPVRGRRVVLQIESQNDLMPGESVAIQFGEAQWIQQLKALRAKFNSMRDESKAVASPR